MIAFQKPHDECPNGWQTGFVEMLPEIRRRLRQAFCRLRAEARDDATAEAVAHCLFAYARLFEQGRVEVASASSLAWYAALQVRSGRQAGGRLNSRELLSLYAQQRHDMDVERLDICSGDEWVAALVTDKRLSVADQVAARMDIRAWLATLPVRMRQIARDLAHGFSTSEVAREYGVTAGRISQLRRELAQSWSVFQHEPAPALAR